VKVVKGLEPVLAGETGDRGLGGAGGHGGINQSRGTAVRNRPENRIWVDFWLKINQKSTQNPEEGGFSWSR